MATVINFVVSLAIPVWGLAVVILGLAWLEFAWVCTGLGIALVGMILMAGNPFAEEIFELLGIKRLFAADLEPSP